MLVIQYKYINMYINILIINLIYFTLYNIMLCLVDIVPMVLDMENIRQLQHQRQTTDNGHILVRKALI